MISELSIGCTALRLAEPYQYTNATWERGHLAEAVFECESCAEETGVFGISKDQAVAAAAWLLRFAGESELATLADSAVARREGGDAPALKREAEQQAREQGVVRD